MGVLALLWCARPPEHGFGLIEEDASVGHRQKDSLAIRKRRTQPRRVRGAHPGATQVSRYIGSLVCARPIPPVLASGGFSQAARLLTSSLAAATTFFECELGGGCLVGDQGNGNVSKVRDVGNELQQPNHLLRSSRA